MTDQVDAAVSLPQQAAFHARIDRMGTDATLEQLPAANDPLLPIRERPNHEVDPARSGYAAHMTVNPDLGERAPARASLGGMEVRSEEVLRRPVPGPLYPWVKRASWFELGLFAALIFFWLAPGFETQTMIFGWAHGLGFIALAILIWVACVRHETPYTLLAATLTPVGPVGSVIAIEWQERRRPAG